MARKRIVVSARGILLVVAAVFAMATGCREQQAVVPRGGVEVPEAAVDYVTAIHDLLSIDSELGLVRNRASETKPVADAVREYVEGIDATDFSACPADFAAAFQWHRDAWRESIPFLEQFPDLRGEMHDVFDEIRSRGGETSLELERLEAQIWDSWREVEAVAADYGAVELQQ